MIIRFAGFGGQGIVLSSYILGQAAVFDGKKALQNQSYGSESRGGETRGDVIISDDEIYDLEPTRYDLLVAMTQPGYEKFISSLKHDGTLINVFTNAIDDLGLDPKKMICVSGIGCSSWIPSPYFKADTLHTTHGRPIAFATGVKIMCPDLTVVVIAGDGDVVGMAFL